MSTYSDDIDDARAERITKNIDLAFRFIEEVIDDPARLDEIPDGATLVLLPPDDPELAAANLGQLDRLSAEGRTVRIERLGVPAPDHLRWKETEQSGFGVRTIRPHWPTDPPADPTNLRVVYDRGRDILLLDFFAGRHAGVAVQRNAIAFLLIDPETQEAFGYLIPDYLARVVLLGPGFAGGLAVAERRPLTIEELGGLVIPGGGAGAESDEIDARAKPASRQDALALLVQSIERLTA